MPARYRVRDDIWETLIIHRADQLESWQSATRYGLRSYGPDTEVGRRLAEAVEFFEFLRRGMHDLLDQWHEQQRAGGRG